MSCSKLHTRKPDAEMLQTQAFVAAFRFIVKNLLLSGHADLALAAGRAQIPVRTLQRRLSDLGVSYSDLVTEIRFNLARELLTDPTEKVETIAGLVGYSDASNFTRAFRRNTGMTPTRYRRSLQKSGQKNM